MKQSKLDFSKAKPKPVSPVTETKSVSVSKSPKAAPVVHEEDEDYEGEEEGEPEDDKPLSKSGNKMLDKFHDMSVKERRRMVSHYCTIGRLIVTRAPAKTRVVEAEEQAQVRVLGADHGREQEPQGQSQL